MGPGGCDKTQEMIDEWERKCEGILGLIKAEYGAGELGNKEVVKKYAEVTPGQTLHTIMKVIRGKYKKGRSLI